MTRLIDPLLLRSSPAQLRKLVADGVFLIAEREGPHAAFEVVEASARTLSRPISMDEMARRIAWEAGITLDDLRGPSRRPIFARPRLRAYAEIYATGHFSLPQIARFFCRVDHTTVLKGIRKHRRRSEGAQ